MRQTFISFSPRNCDELLPNSIESDRRCDTSQSKQDHRYSNHPHRFFQDFPLKIIFTGCVTFLFIAGLCMSLLHK